MIEFPVVPDSYPDEVKAGRRICVEREDHRIVWADLPEDWACRGYFYCADCWYVPPQPAAPLTQWERLGRMLRRRGPWRLRRGARR